MANSLHGLAKSLWQAVGRRSQLTDENEFIDRSRQQVELAGCTRLLAIVCGLSVALSAAALVAQPASKTIELNGHLSAITMGVFTPDGLRAITASTDETARLWDLQNQQEIRQYLGHTGPLYALAISGDGQTLVTGAQDNTVRLWDVPQVKPISRVDGHEGATTGLQRTTDGRWLASIGVDRRLRLWDLAKVKATDPLADASTLSTSFLGHDASLTAVAIRGDGNLLATADQTGRVRLWSPFLEQPQGQFDTGVPIISLAFHSNNQQLFAAGTDGLIRIWQLPAPAHRQTGTIELPITHFAVAKNQSLAVVSTSDQVARVINLDSGEVVREFAKRPATITALSISPNQTLVAIGQDNGDGVVLNLTTGDQVLSFGGHQGAVTEIRFHSDNQQFFTSGVDSSVRSWQIPAPATQAIGHEKPIGLLASSNSSQWHVTASEDQSVRVWQASGQAVRSLGKHAALPTALAIRPDDGQIASADSGGEIRLWNAANGTAEATLWAPDAVTAMAYDRSDSTLLTADSRGWVRRWQVPTTQPVVASGHSQPVRSLVTTPDGKLIISGSQDQSVRVWNADNGQAVRTLQVPGGFGGAITSVTISGDAKRVAAASEAGQFAVWNLSDGSLMHSRKASGGSIRDIAFLASGLQVASLHADQSLNLWLVPNEPVADPDQQTPYQSVKLPDADCRTLAITPNGRSLYISGGAGVVRKWTLNDSKLASDSPDHFFPVGQGPVSDLCISTDGKRLAAASEDKHVYVYDVDAVSSSTAGQAAAPRNRLAHPLPVRQVAFSQDSLRLVSTCDSAAVYLWDLESSQMAQRFQDHAQPVHAVGFADGSARVVSAGSDNAVRINPISVKQLHNALTESEPVAITHLVAGSGDLSFALLTTKGDGVYRMKTDASPLPPLKPAKGKLNTLRASHDGSQLIAASADGHIDIWSSAEGTSLASFAIGGKIADAVISRDGKSIAVADHQTQLRIFSLPEQRLAEVISVADPVHKVSWSTDDQSLITLSPTSNSAAVVNRSLRAFWVTELTGRLAFSLSPDSASLFVGGEDGKVLQLLTSDGSTSKTLVGHSDAITRLIVSENGQRLVSASRDRSLGVWNVADGKLLYKIEHPATISAVSVSANSLRIATASEDGVVRVFDAASGLPLEQCAQHTAGPASVHWLSDNVSLATASMDKSITIYQSSSLRTLDVQQPKLTQMVLISGGTQVVTCSAEGPVVSTDSSSGQRVREYGGATAAATTVAVRGDNQRIAAGTDDAKVLIWNPTNPEPLQTLSADGAVVAIAWSGDNQKLAVATDTNRLMIFGPPRPPQSPQPGNELSLHQDTAVESAITSIAFAADNRSVHASHADGQVDQWLYAAPGPIRQFNHGGPVYGVAASRDGKTIVSCSADQTVRVWDAVTGGQRFQMSGHQGAVHAVAITADESFAVSSGADRTIRLWDIVGGRQLKQLATLDETIYSVAIHPNGQTVAVAGADRNVYLLNLITGATQRTLQGHTDYIHSVGFNASGSRLFSYGYAGQLRIWDPNLDAAVWETRVGRIGNYAHYDASGSRVLLSSGDGIARVQEVPATAR
ncbi:MAG TPA: hypothetical protein DDZ51_02745 [Planctomycetaceae bacterium]|nr:hypothetical protein [Planctomycetaceae bacterium]